MTSNYDRWKLATPPWYDTAYCHDCGQEFTVAEDEVACDDCLDDSDHLVDLALDA